MNINSVKYMKNIEGTGNSNSLRAIIDSIEMLVPQDTANRHYQAIQEWVAKGNTIAEAG